MKIWMNVRKVATTIMLLATFTLGSFASAILLPQRASAATCTSYVYGRGGNGTCVSYIQRIYNAASRMGSSCYIGGKWVSDSSSQITVDGSFGPITYNRTIAFQRSHCIGADGLVGPQTWKKHCDDGTHAGYSVSAYLYSSAWERSVLLSGYRASNYAGCNNNYWPDLR